MIVGTEILNEFMKNYRNEVVWVKPVRFWRFRVDRMSLAEKLEAKIKTSFSAEQPLLCTGLQHTQKSLILNFYIN